MTKTMKTYIDKVTVWHEGEPQATIEYSDGCSLVELHNHYWTGTTWLEVSQHIFQALELHKIEQRDFNKDVA
jgi:hypothetical protein